ncbi:MAG: pyridoxal-phosphate dependent enzyme [Gemmatimonadetes bacterium]|nr:pyridoxal-phosphate dependent enzyme [Gemmatimonadota bacterium]NNF12335.1 pyridoxal-phosphate dependent enzyme [Gemmatimonadota bacterium]NNL31237.1 pyridoxal-phosphate dependent enzyme [Gemmatimonadota bacterium]
MKSEAARPPIEEGGGRASLERLHRWPRLHLATLPTPLRRSNRLGVELGAANVYLKMDAETGFALGGNKVRKLEFELAPDRLDGVTHLITAGGPQSNHCRVTAAAAARLGLGCVLVTQAPEPETPRGNALLHRLFGAEMVTVANREDRLGGMEDVAARIEAQGGHPRVVPVGASTGLGCLGYALAAWELVRQLGALADGCTGTTLYVSSSSGGTLAGLVLGLALLGRDDVSVVAVSADAPADELRTTALSLAAEGAELLAAPPDLASIPLAIDDSQVGDGYGIPTRASTQALERFARTEGVVLDPTYTAKAAAGMIAALERKAVLSHRRVVFVHTGGAPGLLA